MSLQTIGAAVKRVKSAFQRRPEIGLHDDVPVIALWESGTKVVARNAQGFQVSTDMPVELGGSGECVTPGWLFRAGLASCAVTSITLAAAESGVDLTALSVYAGSQSDARGLLGMSEPTGAPVYAGPFGVELRIHIAALGISPEALTALVENSLSHSPVPSALTTATPFKLLITVGAA